MTGELSRTSAVRMVQEENQRLKDELHQLRAQCDLYRDFVRALYELQMTRASVNSESELLDFLGHVIECAVYTSQAADGSLLLTDSDTDELVFVQVRGSISTTLPGFRLKKGEGISGWVAEHNSAQVVNEPHRDPRFLSRVDDHFQFVTRNLVAVPIKGSKRVLGVIEVLNKLDHKDFTAHDMEMVSVLANVAATAIERMEAASSRA